MDYRQIEIAKQNYIRINGIKWYLEKYLEYLKASTFLTQKEIFEKYYSVRNELYK